MVTGSVISSTTNNNTNSDLATGLSTCILKDGTQTTTAIIPFTTGISTPSSTFALINTTATTVNAFGGTTAALNMGNATGTTTILGATFIAGKVTITQPATAATLTIANNGSLITSGAFAVTLTATGTTNVTLPTSGTLATTAQVGGGLLAAYNFTCQTQALTSISNATPAVFTCTSAAHLPETGSPVQFTTSGTLPTGLSLLTTYYVTNPSASTYNVCTTLADAMAGTNKVNTTGAGSGTHTMNSIYVKNASSAYVIVEVWGAGGGSGGVNASSFSVGGGGAGGYSRKKILLATLGATETLTIGAGGTAGANTGTNGGTGGTSSFGAHATATGGALSVGGTTSSCSPGGVGGAGASGDLNLTGMTGIGGVMGNGGAAAQSSSGAGGSTTLGGNGVPVAALTGPGIAGKNNSGSGASGALGSSAQVGAIGGSGRVLVYEYT